MTRTNEHEHIAHGTTSKYVYGCRCDLCRAAHSDYARRWYKEPGVAERAKNQKLVKQYGITLVQWTAIFDLQGHRCAICRTDEPGSMGWAVDHCHMTNVVRGILCCRCNIGIGHFKDEPQRLRLAADYLERTR